MYSKKELENDVQELLSASVIDEATAQSIQAYYSKQRATNSNAQHTYKKNILTILLSIFGALSIGGGIVLVFAHNWSALPQAVKIFIAIALLVIAQILCAYVFIRKKQSLAWREGSACFLYFSLAASMSLISQIYHIPSNTSQFLFTILMLMLPMLYIFRSQALSLLYSFTVIWLLLETFFLTEGLFYSHVSYLYKLKSLIYLIPFILSLLFYVQFQKSIATLRKVPLVMIIQNWAIAIAFFLGASIVMMAFLLDLTSVLWAYYILVFQILYLFGSRIYQRTEILVNAYKTVGTLGILVVIYQVVDGDFYRFDDVNDIGIQRLLFFGVIFLLSLLAYAFIMPRSSKHNHKGSIATIDIFSILCVAYLFAFIVQDATYQIVARVSKNAVEIGSGTGFFMFNALILVAAFLMLLQSIKKFRPINIRQLNFSVFLIILWIVQRFLITDLSYLIRGIVLVISGIVFFQMNMFSLRKNKEKVINENNE